MGPEETMSTITLPPDLAERLADEARRRGTTPELLALEGLRRLFAPASGETMPTNGTSPGPSNLYEYLGDFIGGVAGSGEALSEDCTCWYTDQPEALWPKTPTSPTTSSPAA